MTDKNRSNLPAKPRMKETKPKSNLANTIASSIPLFLGVALAWIVPAPLGVFTLLGGLVGMVAVKYYVGTRVIWKQYRLSDFNGGNYD